MPSPLLSDESTALAPSLLWAVASMGFDLLEIASPTARVAGAWAWKAAPLTLATLPLVLTPWMLLFLVLPNKRRIVEKIGLRIAAAP